jgi:hypothetical protein
MLCGIEQFAVALAAAWFDNPDADPQAVVAGFCKSHFGIPRVGKLARTLLDLSAEMPHRNQLRTMLNSQVEAEQPATALEVKNCTGLANRVLKLRAALLAAEKNVRRNEIDFRNYILAADVLIWAARRRAAHLAGQSAADRKRLLAEGKKLLKRCRADWNRGRYADDPKRDSGGKVGRWTDALIPNLHVALNRLA